MKRSIPLVLLAILFLSCEDPKPLAFDLSAITFKQKIEEVVKTAGLKLDDGKSKAWTVAGYQIFESSDPKILKFNGVELAGKAGDSVNRVLIHYALRDQTVKMVEIKVFSAPEIKKIQDALDQKLGKALYPDYAYETAVSHDVTFFKRVWIEPGNTKGYFFIDAVNKEKKEQAGLAMVDYSDVMMNRVVAVKGYTQSVTLGVEAVKALMKSPPKK